MSQTNANTPLTDTVLTNQINLTQNVRYIFEQNNISLRDGTDHC